MKNKITIKDVAESAGVAKSTVSRYFNGGYVKDETKSKIKEAVDKLGFIPNSFAQSLKAKESKIIGVITPCFDSITTSRTLMAIDEYLKDNDYQMSVVNANHSSELELKYIDYFIAQKVDGIILIATTINDELVLKLKQCDSKIVVLGQEIDGVTSIYYDDYLAGAYVGKLINNVNLNKVVYLGVDESDVAVGIVRKMGFLSEVNKDLRIIHTDFSFEQAYLKISELLKDDIPEVIVCATDKLAFGAYKAIQETNYQIGKDIKVIGFGGYETSSLLNPSLTTLKFDNNEAGRCAAMTIINLIKKESVYEKQVIGFKLIEGESF